MLNVILILLRSTVNFVNLLPFEVKAGQGFQPTMTIVQDPVTVYLHFLVHLASVLHNLFPPITVSHRLGHLD